MKKALALDLHGIIDANPIFFAEASKSLVKDGWQIHILTGSHIVDQGIEAQLKKLEIDYTHLFSIADYHRENKTEGMWYDVKGDPWVSDEDWDKTKADYCKRNDILFCIDDTARYARNFETPFGYMSIQMSNKQPNRYLEYVIDMFKKRSRKNILIRFELWFNSKFSWFISPSSKLVKEHRDFKNL